MKKHISLLAILAVLTAISFGCKVGADDPATLASRDGRITATWKLTGVVDSTVTTNTFGTFVSTVSYNGTILTETDVFGTSTKSYSLNMDILKDGILTVMEVEDGDALTETNYWEWIGADKNKSQILLNSNSMAGGMWIVRRLAGDELVLEQHSMVTETSNGTTSSNDRTIRLTFIAD